QLKDDTSTLSLYRAALGIRRGHPDLGDGSLTWLDSPPGTLAFTRGDSFACLVNMTSEWVEIGDVPGELLLASREPDISGRLTRGSATCRLAPDSATWWATGRV